MEGDRERWNARWREQAGELAPPSAFFLEHAHQYPDQGRALDIAGGAGRHTVWLARRGLDVTMIDVSDVAIERAERRAGRLTEKIRFLRIDLDEPDGQLPRGPFDLIVMIHFLHRGRRDEIARLLTDGGVLIAAQPTIHNLERHPRPPREYLLADGELVAWAASVGLELVVSREGWNPEGRHEAELIGRRSPELDDPRRMLESPSDGGPYR